MASSKDYLEFVLGQLSDLDGVTHRPMMGEFILYYQGKVIGGIYDDRLLLKPTKAAQKMIEHPVYDLPYEGAKEMLLIEEVDEKAFLCALVEEMVDELPAVRPKKKKK